MKRTPLARRTPLRAKAALKATTRLAPVSAARKATNRVRRDVVARLVAERGPGCQAPDYGLPCTALADDAHEPLTRARGGSIVDPDAIVLLCRTHHDWVHAMPVEAVERGLLRHSWDVPADQA